MVIYFLCIFSFFQITYAGMPVQLQEQEDAQVLPYEYATKVLNGVVYQLPSPSIISEHEWKEFQLDRLISILDRTKTSFGRWGLKQLLYPIADSDELMQRKNIITFLIEHEKELSTLQEQLDTIHSAEKSLLAYFDPQDFVDQGSQQFYYNVPGLKDYLNNSSLALNGSVATQMVDAWKGLLVAMCLGGLYKEWTEWYLNKEKETFDWEKGIQEGLTEPLRKHSWYPHLELQKPYTYKDVVRVAALGSWRDMYEVLSEGYSFDASKFGVSSKLSYATNKTVGITQKIFAFLSASAGTLVYDYYWGSSLLSVASHIAYMNQTLNQLYDRIVDVATCLRTIKTIHHTLEKYPELENPHYTTMGYSDQMSEFIKQFAGSRFKDKGSYLYSRGHVLSVHQEIKKIKRSLVPVLQSVAFLDAYCSIAQLYKESQQQRVKFSFPEFVSSSNPSLLYDNAWLALLPYQEAVTNNLCLNDKCPGKIVITGPNGGGKSTVLKMFGVGAILAQSWSIVPATYARQTLFDEIKTGFSPEEDLAKGLSKGMSQIRKMNELSAAMQEGEAQKKNMLVLIDEPYSGIVEDVAATRIYEFGKNVADFSHIVLAIATHSKKPIFLEADTHGLFGNYQVKIIEKSPGNFERLFKLERGPANWWFENSDQRSRFVDWISAKSEKAQESAEDVFKEMLLRRRGNGNNKKRA